MERAFIQDTISFLTDRFKDVRNELMQRWKGLMTVMKGLDRVRISGFISRNDEGHREREIKKNQDYLTRLKQFGNIIGQYSNIFNLAGIQLSKLEREVLSRGLDFGVPHRTSREDILAEFEVLYRQLK